MKYLLLLSLTGLVLLVGCAPCCSPETHEKNLQEIRDVEKAFAEMVASDGLHRAFTTFAADDAAIMRSNALQVGKAAIDKFYEGQNVTGLSWEPEYVDVSKSGDLGYTYGHYKYSTVDSTGQVRESIGVFHTVWKRQEDGSWKFVWD